MIELCNELEKTIIERSTNSLEFVAYFSESKETMINTLANPDSEDTLFDIIISGKRVKEEFNKLLLSGDSEACLEFAYTYGRKASKEEAKILHAASLLALHGHHELSQVIADKIKANDLRNKLFPELIEKIQKNAHSDKQSEVAKKPRNKHHDEAIRIAKRTWNKYPYASKKGMCRKLYEYFHGQVSIDTLGRWLAKIKPRVKSKDTYFSLVL